MKSLYNYIKEAEEINISKSIDYNQFTKTIDNIYYYKKDISPIKINYEMKAMDFDCK